MSVIDTNLLTPELVFLDFEAKDRLDLFRRLSDELVARGYVKETWLDAILERERNYPTGLACTGASVALPHVDPAHLLRPYIAVIRPKTPVEFDGMADTGLVNAELVVNLGIMAHEESQVAVLQAFLGIFIDEAASAEILAQNDPQGMVDAIVRHCS